QRQPASFVHGQEDELADALAPGAIAPFRNHTDSQTNNVVDAGALAGDSRFHRGVKSVVGNRQSRSRLTIAVWTDSVLARERLNVVLRRAGRAPGRVRGQHVQMHEAADWRRILQVRI